MITERSCFTGVGNWIAPEITAWYDPENEITADYIASYLQARFNLSNLAAKITQDTFKYKTGFMKSETTACLVVTSVERGENLSRFIIAVKKEYEVHRTVAACYWFGESESQRIAIEHDRIADQYNRGLKKQDKQRQRDIQYGSTLNIVGRGITNSITNKVRNNQMEKLVDKYNQARIGEDEYYEAVVRAVSSVFDVITEDHGRVEVSK